MERHERGLTDLLQVVAAAQDAAAPADPALAQAWRRLSATRPERSGRRPWWAFAAGGAALAGAAAALALWWTAPVRFAVGTAGPGAVGAALAAPADHALPVVFSEGTRIELLPGARGRVDRVHRTGADVAIEAGVARVAVVPRAQGRWRLAVGPFRVRVTGTRFVVGWDAAAERFHLQMEEGSLVVSGGCLEGERRLSGREALSQSCGRRGGGEPLAPRAAAAPVLPGASAEAPVPEARGPRGPQPEPRLRGRAPAPAEAPPSWSDLSDRGRYREALAAAEAAGFDRLCQASSAAELYRLGDTARLAGAADRARAAFESLRRRFAGHPRAAEAAYALGRIAADQDRAGATAVRWFTTYLREAPRGPLAAEASGRLLEAHVRAGDREAARRQARDVLARDPNGAYAELARQTLATP
jgi:TolA-binding protein